MGWVRRCTRFHIRSGQLHDRREHRVGSRGGGKIGLVTRAVLFNFGGGRLSDRRQRDEAFAGCQHDWLVGRQRRGAEHCRSRRA